MGSSIVTFNTLQLFCKCFTIPLHNNSHKHAPTFLNPVNKCSNSHFTAVFSALSCNSAAQTLDFTNDDDRPSEIVLNDGKSRKNGKRLNLVGNNEKGSGISDIEALNFSKNDDNSSEMVVYDGKSRNNGKRFNLGVKKEKGSGISAVEDGKSRNNGKTINLGVRNEKGNNVGAFEALEFRKNVDNPSENGKNGKRFNFGVRNDDESSSGVSFFHPSNGIVEGKVSEGVVDGSKGRNNGERFNLESRSVKGNGISGHHGSVERENSKRSDLVERNEKGRGGSSLGDKRVGFDHRRNWEKSSGDSGWSREHGDRNYGKSGGRIHVGKRSEMGNGRLSLKLSGGGGMGGVERSSGSVDFDNDNKGKNGYGVSNRRPIDDKVASGVVSGKGLRRLERILECVALVDESKGEKGSTFSSTRPKDAKTSSVDNGNVHGNDSKVKRKRKKLSKKDKDESPQFQLRIGLDMCCKKGDVMGAISLYDSAVKQGVKMEQYQYTVLLYLCSSAATGVIRPSKSGSGTRSLNNDTEEDGDDVADDMDDEGLEIKDKNEKLEMNEIRVSDDVKKYALERGLEVYERMCSDKVEMNEAALTSVARMAMAMANGDMAFDMVIQMKSMGINPRLRSYGPALSVFSSKGELEKAFAVENHMLENGVYPEEPELEALLRVSIQCGKADKVYYVLHKLRTSVRSVSPSTAEVIEKWFRTQQASRVGKRKWDANMLAQTMENVGGGWHGQGWLGSGKWNVSRTSIGADGLCKCCGEKLALIDLDPEETDRFAESVASIAIRREKNLSFQKFQRWLDYYGPFEAVVDAANVGLLSQRMFKPSKVNAVVNGIRQLLPSKKWPLIILHNRRVTGSKMEEPINKALVDRWKNADALYATPTGSNDDWYWLYAAIKFKCLLVTNDEMRDHTFQLLGNDFFPKWKERHQVRFNFSEIGPVFYMPPPCSVVIQESNKGLWHVPIASENRSEEDRTWLCISRPKSLGKQEDPNVGADPREGHLRA